MGIILPCASPHILHKGYRESVAICLHALNAPSAHATRNSATDRLVLNKSYKNELFIDLKVQWISAKSRKGIGTANMSGGRGPPRPGDLDDNELPALFWESMPDDEENADMSAIQAIIDESTPEERAKNYKDQGNSALKTGLDLKKKFYLKQAIEQYTLGLDLGCKSMEINVQLLCNRAHVSLLLGNNRNAAEDAKRAVKLDPSSIKAHYRGAKASIALGEFESALEFCTAGLELEPSNDGLAKIAERAKAEGVAHARRRAAEAARQAALRAPAKRLAECLLQRGWRIGRPQFKIEIDKPWQDEEGIVHWPALCFYPEASMEQDVVQDMSENDCIGDHLDVMYGPDAPPLSWDTNGEYSRGSVEMYYLSHAATPLDAEQLTEALFGSWPEAREEGPQRYGDKAARWVRVNEKKTLGEILSSPDLVVPGIPVFFVLSSKTSYKQQFLLGDIPLF